MDFFEVNKIVINSLKTVLDDTAIIQPLELEEERVPVRLKESRLTVTENIARNRAAVTAHNLSEYKTSNYSLVMHTKQDTWLIKLIEAQKTSLGGG